MNILKWQYLKNNLAIFQVNFAIYINCTAKIDLFLIL